MSRVAASSTTPPRSVWMDGSIVPWSQACLHVDTQCVQGGLNAYEVVSGFWSDDTSNLYLFRLNEHLERLWNSTKVMRLYPPFSKEELRRAMQELIVANGFREDVLVRITCYLGAGPLFSHEPEEIDTGLFMVAKPAVPNPKAAAGLAVCTSIWNRLPDVAASPRVKSGANYQNVRLAQIQAHVDAYDDAVILNQDGKVCELPLANIFMVRNGAVATPNVTSGILEGITRRTVLDISPEVGIPIVEREIDRSELYMASEAFVSRTSGGIWPILSIDRYPVGDGSVGPITKQFRKQLDALRRHDGGHPEWLTPIYS